MPMCHGDTTKKPATAVDDSGGQRWNAMARSNDDRVRGMGYSCSGGLPWPNLVEDSV